jgi:hypothetical protein
MAAGVRALWNGESRVASTAVALDTLDTLDSWRSSSRAALAAWSPPLLWR